jgi:hypothetical protein
MCLGFNAGVILKTLLAKVRPKKAELPAKLKKAEPPAKLKKAEQHAKPMKSKTPKK